MRPQIGLPNASISVSQVMGNSSSLDDEDDDGSIIANLGYWIGKQIVGYSCLELIKSEKSVNKKSALSRCHSSSTF